MRRSGYGKLRNLPKLRHESKLLHYWLARRLAQTALKASRSVHSCLPSSAHPPSKTLLSELATEGQRHQLHRWSSLLQADALDHVPQKGPFWFSPSDAPVHPHLMDFCGNPARATQVFPDASADHGQSDDCLGNAATFHDAHVWAQRHSSGKTDSNNGLAYWQSLMVLSQRTCQARLPRTPSPSEKSSRKKFSGALCLVSVSSPLVSGVSTLCGLWDGPCFNLSSFSFSSANRKTYFVHQTQNCWTRLRRKILTIP